MARKRFVFFRAIQPLLKARSWGNRFLLALVTALLCITVFPVLTTAPSLNSAVPSLVQQGKALYKAEKFTEATQVLQQAADTFRTNGEELKLGMTLSNLSLAYQQLGQWQKAEEVIAESLKLLQSGQDAESQQKERSQLLAQALDVRGRLQLARGQAQSALTTWRKAASIYAEVGDEARITRSRINQAQALQSLGLYRQAEETLTESSQRLQKQPDSSLKATGLRSLGNIFRVIGNLKESRQVLEQSLDVARSLQSREAISETLLSLGNTASAQQDTQTAKAFYRQAATASASAVTRIQAQLNRLNLLLETEQWEAAQALQLQIQPQIADLSPSRAAVYARIHFAQSLMKMGSRKGRGREDAGTRREKTSQSQEIAQILAKAIQQAKSLGDQPATSYALGNLGELYEQTQQRTEAIDLTQQALFIAQAVDSPEIAYRWQWQLGRLLREQGNIQDAIAAYTEAVNNLQSLRSDLVAMSSDVQYSFREKVEPVYRQLVELLLQSQGSSEPSQENLAQARRTIESLQLAQLDNYFQEACLDPLEQVDFVDEKAAIIYPIILDERLEVVLSLPGEGLRHYGTGVRSQQVDSLIKKLRQKLVLPYTSQKEINALSQKVYNWLIQPAETALAESKIETLVFVPDGSFRNIPMAALHDGKQYLIENYNVALTPGLRLFEPKPLAQMQLEALTAGVSQSRFGFKPLEYVKTELAQIQSEIPAEVLLNQEFTSTSLDNEVNSSPVPVVHIATHGQFSSQTEETYILAWDEQINVNELDNLLRVRDQSLPSELELLVLSACETAQGDERAALGLAGVAVRAGARSTLASLWLVEDQSTALLMSRFYQELETGVSKAKALRNAQQALLQGEYQHPRFWASFVLLGNWL
ncbi:MAG: hypothetical protein BRC48_08050 [Cyanobacteria bacterium QS_9_48_30]|nr:MAG: hypothetical protein BRC48_08050 [Cyanobacteria bacterium QS_9_48_30]